MADESMDNNVDQEFPFVVDWSFEAPRMFAKEVNAKLRNKEQTQEVPSWITKAIDQKGKVNEDSLKSAIFEFLKEAGDTDESIGLLLIQGITRVTLLQIIAALSLIENDPFMQDVMRAVLREHAASGGRADFCLANLAILRNNKDKLVTGEPIGPLPVAENNVHLFRECSISIISYLL